MVRAFERIVRKLNSDRNFSEIVIGSIFALSARVTATGLAMLASIVIARIYGAKAMGILAMINSFLVLVTIFTTLGTDTSILRLIPEYTARYSVTSAFHVYRKTQYFIAAVSLVTGAFFFLSSGIVAGKVFSKPHLSFLFGLAAIFVVFRSLMLLNTMAIRGLMLIRTFAFMQVLPALAMLLILLVATVFFRNPNNPVYAQLAAWSITAVIGAWIADRAFRNRMRPEDSVHSMQIRDIASISFPMLMTAWIHFFTGQIGVIILGMLRSESEVGYYSVVVKLATLAAFVLQAINSMAAPKFSELYHTGRIDELFHVARKSTKLIFWTTAPILLILVLLGRPVLGLAFGKDFVVAYPAMVLLVIGQFVNSISGSTGHFMNMTGCQGVFRNIILAAAIINVALSLVLIPRYGINGAALASMVSLGYWNIRTLLFIKFKYGTTIGYVPLVRYR